MPVRKATPEETAAWLGNGLVLFGMKRPDFFPKSSTPPSEPPASASPAPLDLQNLPFDPAVEAEKAMQRSLESSEAPSTTGDSQACRD